MDSVLLPIFFFSRSLLIGELRALMLRDIKDQVIDSCLLIYLFVCVCMLPFFDFTVLRFFISYIFLGIVNLFRFEFSF